MPTYYLDTSALIKCYVPERGTRWILALVASESNSMSSPSQLVTSLLALAEGGAALARRQRTGELTEIQRAEVFDRFVADCRDRYKLLSVDESMIHHAALLTQRHPLRGYDAVHLATALRIRHILTTANLPAPIFVSADINLCAAAQGEGLAVENPNDYP